MTEEQKEAVAEPQEQQAPTGEQAQPEREKAGLQEALVAERRRRQDAERYSKYLEEQQKAFQMQSQTKQPEEDEDEYTKELKKYTESQIQNGIKSALEREYIAKNPQLVDINPETGRTWLEDKLEPILQKKPYLAMALKEAPNRYARAVEIIEDYSPKTYGGEDAKKKLEENAVKPGNPAGVTKSGGRSELEQISKMSRKEFSAYRASLRGKAPNIR